MAKFSYQSNPGIVHKVLKLDFCFKDAGLAALVLTTESRLLLYYDEEQL